MQQILNTLNVFCNIEHFQCAALEHICSMFFMEHILNARTCSKLEHKDALKAMQQILNAKTGSTPWRCSIWNIRHLKLNTCNTVVFINEHWCSVSWTPLKHLLWKLVRACFEHRNAFTYSCRPNFLIELEVSNSMTERCKCNRAFSFLHWERSLNLMAVQLNKNALLLNRRALWLNCSAHQLN